MAQHTSRERKRICIDMDEVIADAVAENLQRYNRQFGECLTRDDMAGKWIWDVVSVDRHHALEEYLRSEDFFAVLGVMPESQRVIHALQQRYEVFIATAAMEVPSSFKAKYEWLGRHFPFITPSHIVFCGDKGILNAEFLIDDNPRQLRRFEGEGILYTSHHNLNVEGFRRVNDWLDVERMFLA
jgi:5'(3')-deoxyribonucleotidase